MNKCGVSSQEANSVAMTSIREKPYGTDSLFELLTVKTLLAIGTTKMLRGGLRLLPQIAVGVTVLLFGAYLWSSHFANHSLGFGHVQPLEWKIAEPEVDRRIDGSLRIVVFGGGDVATPNKASWKIGGPNAGWTEVLCQQASLRTSLISLYVTHRGSN